MKKAYFIIFLFVTTIHLSSFAWGKQGHEMVAKIARNFMTKSIQDSVQKYLGDMTFEEASTWMDDMRSDHFYDFMKTWHYINVEKDDTYVKTKEENIVNEIQIAINLLKNKRKHTHSDINNSIKILFHLAGDISQPLHVGYGNDKGGNEISVKLKKGSTNLHKLWDFGIIEEKNITLEDCLKFVPKLSAMDISEYQKIDVVQWMNDARIFLPEVYDFKAGKITEEYIDKNAIIIEKQLLIAGIRLAGVMNEVFKK